ncbi:hypothetical protein JHK85_025690 [Glycine max]|uniref:Uncharacterized protein n=1 Tax=Glycine soja TaxID=3848 RepID=A0A0B2QSY2_GLYSO|nr:hypothetical protein JHK85_025690 [Glycine max]KAG5012930.1 hypothetical protein JHK86_025191 [Glycine max]KHN23209.1 hypothetical protein glysoja_042489 [Glycine soja]
MGLYVVNDQSTMLVALGKVYDNSSTIHTVPYVDDVTRVRFVSQAVGTFIRWPTHLVKKKAPPKSVGSLERGTVGGAIDPLGELVKNLFVVYQKPFELSWDGAKFGILNSKNGFFITHADVTEIILGDKCLNIYILQLWMMFMNDWSTSIGFAKVYGFLKPQSILRAKDRHEECKQYIETWVKESHREVYFGPYLNQKSLDVHIKACNEETTTLKGKADRPTPRWIEAKSHVQVGAYECGYYVMHWMWCIVSGSLKNEWNKAEVGDDPLRLWEDAKKLGLSINLLYLG